MIKADLWALQASQSNQTTSLENLSQKQRQNNDKKKKKKKEQKQPRRWKSIKDLDLASGLHTCTPRQGTALIHTWLPSLSPPLSLSPSHYTFLSSWYAVSPSPPTQLNASCPSLPIQPPKMASVSKRQLASKCHPVPLPEWGVQGFVQWEGPKTTARATIPGKLCEHGCLEDDSWGGGEG